MTISGNLKIENVLKYQFDIPLEEWLEKKEQKVTKQENKENKWGLKEYRLIGGGIILIVVVVGIYLSKNYQTGKIVKNLKRPRRNYKRAKKEKK